MPLLILLLPLIALGVEICKVNFNGYSGNLGLLECKNLERTTYSVELDWRGSSKVFTYKNPNSSDYLPFAVPYSWSGNVELKLLREGLTVGSVKFEVKPLERRTSYIKVKRKAANPKVHFQYYLLRKISDICTPVRYYEAKPFPPLKSYKRISSPFGVRRFVNGKPSGFHKGVDFAAPTGTPVFATLSGKVVLARKLYLTGNTVVIDHGWCLESLYTHLSKIEVKEGDFVKRGQEIGKVGSTGRSTGPHLHFGVYLKDTPVDPIQFLKEKLKPAEGGD